MKINLVYEPEQSLNKGFWLLSRRTKDRFTRWLFLITTAIPLLVLIFAITGLVWRTWPILKTHSLWELLTGRTWLPLKGLFGFYPFITGTLWVTTVAMVIAVPPCLLCAIYLAEYAHKSIRKVMRPLLDILSGIPSVIYGVWGIIVIVPLVQKFLAPWISARLGFLPVFAENNPTGYSILSGGLVLGLMVAPLIIAITYEVIQAVPDGLRQASLALGTTQWQTIKYVIVPKVFPGIVAAVVLGFSRVFGETIAVLMVVGNVAKVPTSIFDPAYPLTALIANNYGEMMSIPLYDAALMGAALMLLIIVLLFNIFSNLALNRIVRRL
jgi:phosphate transport system permease protein